MSKRSIRGESSSITAPHKRHASATLDEGPPPASLAQASSIPKIPIDLITNLILPFVLDRATWNSVYCASKDLCLAGKKMTPPWPNKTFNVGHASVGHVTFSPSGSHLAFVIDAGQTTQYQRYDAVYQTVVHVWDRWGKETLLAGHTAVTYCLEYSLDGEYLASGSADRSIRLWRTESFHTTSSNISSERPTRTPEEADIILSGSLSDAVITLSFSRTDSNLLASGGRDGEIKLWNVRDQACIHSFPVPRSSISSLFFAGGAVSACIAVTADTGSIIRLWKAEGSSDFASETIGEAGGRGRRITNAALSRCGFFLATASYLYSSNMQGQTLELYDLETMTNIQSTGFMPGLSFTCIAVSPDSKQVVVCDLMGRIRLLHTGDFSVQRDLDTRKGTSGGLSVSSVAFDPTGTCRVLAFGFNDGTLELQTNYERTAPCIEPNFRYYRCGFGS
jgi:WD40 repeat protein